MCGSGSGTQGVVYEDENSPRDGSWAAEAALRPSVFSMAVVDSSLNPREFPFYRNLNLINKHIIYIYITNFHFNYKFKPDFRKCSMIPRI